MLSSLSPKSTIAIYPIVTRPPETGETGPQDVTSGVPVRVSLAELTAYFIAQIPPAAP